MNIDTLPRCEYSRPPRDGEDLRWLTITTHDAGFHQVLVDILNALYLVGLDDKPRRGLCLGDESVGPRLAYRFRDNNTLYFEDLNAS